MTCSFCKLMVLAMVVLSQVTGCKKDQNPVPRVNVDLWFYNIEADPQFAKLTGPYNAIVVTGGFKNNGIMIYRYKIENDIDDFVAYDRTCPYEVSDCKSMWTTSNPYYTVCACCKSKYNIIGEYMESGPSKFMPRKLKTEYINGNLHIY